MSLIPTPTFHPSPKTAAFIGGMGIALVLCFGGGVFYATRLAPEQTKAAGVAMDQFLEASRKRDYDGARGFMTRDLASNISSAALAAKWKKFEVRNGPLVRWVGTDRKEFRGGINLYPREVSFDLFVLGPKQDRGRAISRLIPENGQWRVQSFEIYP